MLPIMLVFHAEKLHDERVWRRVERVARWLAVQGRQAIFFVYPFCAQVAGQEITARVRTLAVLGHEIGQHTHFYAGTKIDKREKVNDPSAANMVQCLIAIMRPCGVWATRPRPSPLAGLPPTLCNAQGRLLCLPTTRSLGAWWKRGRNLQARDHRSHQIVYTHDYDLLSLHTYLLLWSFLVMTHRKRLVSASLLVKRLWEDKMYDLSLPSMIN
jgi:hypothetical protein